MTWDCIQSKWEQAPLPADSWLAALNRSRRREEQSRTELSPVLLALAGAATSHHCPADAPSASAGEPSHISADSLSTYSSKAVAAGSDGVDRGFSEGCLSVFVHCSSGAVALQAAVLC